MSQIVRGHTREGGYEQSPLLPSVGQREVARSKPLPNSSKAFSVNS